MCSASDATLLPRSSVISSPRFARHLQSLCSKATTWHAKLGKVFRPATGSGWNVPGSHDRTSSKEDPWRRPAGTEQPPSILIGTTRPSTRSTTGNVSDLRSSYRPESVCCGEPPHDGMMIDLKGTSERALFLCKDCETL